MPTLCAPAIIYLIFSVTQVLIDLYKGLYNTAIIKVIVAFMVTLLLNILCQQGLSFVSWIIVFIPFLLMTVLVSMLLYIFGLDAASGGTFDYTCNGKEMSKSTSWFSGAAKCSADDLISTDEYGNILIYDPEYNPYLKPVRYVQPNIVIPNPHANDVQKTTVTTYYGDPFPRGSSSPAFQ